MRSLPKESRRNESSRGWKGFVGSHPLMSVAPLNVPRTRGARSTPSRSAPPRPLPRLLRRGRRSCSLGGDRVLYAPGRPRQPVGIAAADDFEPSVVELQKGKLYVFPRVRRSLPAHRLLETELLPVPVYILLRVRYADGSVIVPRD